MCLTVSNASGADSSCQLVTVSCDVPSVDWSFNSTNFYVSFTDLSTSSPNFWLWDFGYGNTSTNQNPNQTYVSTGSCTVCLTSVNDCGADSSCQIVAITCDAPSTDWSFNTTNLNASFTDLSSNSPNAWLWDFGDGNTSTSQNPNHSYASTGSYTVCLTSINDCGADSTCSILILENLLVTEVDLDQTTIFPNPTSNKLIIDIPINETEISIYNIDGRIVRHFYTFSEKVNLDISSFSKGVYVVHMKSGNQYVTKSFVKE